jgi:hypothetical protein
MNENQIFRQGFRGLLISVACILLALVAVSLSTNYQYPNHPYCGNMVAAGFPVLFICDDWGGGSPTSSWNKIDFVDVINGGIVPGGFLIDFLFYFIVIGLVWFTMSSRMGKGLNGSDLWWTVLISTGFFSGFLCAFLMLIPAYWNYVRPPLFRFQAATSTPSIQTPIGEISTISPTITPIATSSP